MKGGELVNPPGTFCSELRLHATMHYNNFCIKFSKATLDKEDKDA